MKIAVCDDDRVVREELFWLIKKQAADADVLAYQSGEEMINAGQDFDISFLDIETQEHNHFCDRVSGIHGRGF